MPRVINSVEVIHQSSAGPDFYKVGGTSPHGQAIADIIEQDGVYYFYDDQDELIMEIKNCPVVVTYHEIQESEEIQEEEFPF